MRMKIQTRTRLTVSFLFILYVGVMIKGEEIRTNNGTMVRKQGMLLPVLAIIVACVALLSFVSIYAYKKINRHLHDNPSITKLQAQWAAGDYEGVYETSTALIEKNPLNNTILTHRGYAAFFIAVSQIDPTLAQEYINESIRSLRIALMTAKENTVPQIKYMLGKAYFYKDTICSYHFYADLVIKYLEEALANGFEADDIPELLGLSYGQLGMPYESIKRFSDALLVRESDFLLFNIAKEYYAQGQISASKQYLYQVTSRAQDDNLLLRSQNLLAKIYIDEEKYDEAKELFEQILDKNENSADAHYGLGIIYEKAGDMVKARAEWRKCLKIDSTYEDALKKVYR